MSAEPIARVVADLQAGRAKNGLRDHPDVHAELLKRCQGMTVVDATAIYHSLADNPRPVYLYEDHPCIAPPWSKAAICYVNEHGNVIVMQALATELLPVERREQLWPPADPVDWSRVRWRIDTAVWLGGGSVAVGPLHTFGPVHGWSFAVYDDGKPADLRWVQMMGDYPREHWEMANLILLGALNFMNCRNVELVEPRRERHERKRIARMGVKVHTISVFPVGRSTRSRGEASDGQGTPLTSVAGHFAHYGPAYGRGLLFGKLEGRYWIPQHARGAEQHGRSEADYRLVPESRTVPD